MPDPTGRATVPPRARLVALFAATTAANAALLFSVEPLVSRQLLPRLGGTSAVWNTCLMAFQALLLAGYLYAHLLTRRLGVRAQAAVHLALLAASCLVLPVAAAAAAPEGWPPAAAVVWLLLAAVGAPFVVLAAGAPLLQRWYAAAARDAGGATPYALYAASNAGSLAALLAYPLLVEPRLGLAAQGRAWSWAYGALGLLLGTCALLVARRAPAPAAEHAGFGDRPGAESGAAAPAVPWAERARWTFLAFVPSALLLGLTRYLSTDVAPVPLLWVVPLAVYLLTFVLAFAERVRVPDVPRDVLVALLVPVLAVLVALGANAPLWAVAAAHLVAFGVVALACHQQLADRRPAVARLTEYYLWIAAGGLLGGVFDALVAPALFDTLAEYPVAVGLAAAAWALEAPRAADAGASSRGAGMAPARAASTRVASTRVASTRVASTRVASARVEAARRLGARVGARLAERPPPAAPGRLWSRRPRTPGTVALLVGPAAVLAAVMYAAAARLPILPRSTDVVPSAALGTAAALVACALGLRAGRDVFAVAVAGLLAGGLAGQRARGAGVVTRVRSFYGAYTVRATDTYRHLQHGSTLHGAQDTRAAYRTTPLTYYHAGGPLGALFARVPRLAPGAPPRRVAVAGLGTGTLACWGRAGESWTFYEVDPLMARLARDPRLFTFLRDCPPRSAVVVGDARVQLARAPRGAYDLVLLDAFSSDAIPTHLLTREAVALYLARLAPGGVLAVHVSNRYLDLVPVVARLAGDAGAAAAVGRDVSGASRGHPFLSTSVWVALARDSAALGTLPAAPGWQALPATRAGRAWSDDYTNVLAAVRWH